MRPCSLTGEYRGFGQDILPPIFQDPVKTDPELFSKTFITMYQSTHCPNPDRIMNTHHSQHLKSCTKEYKEQVKCGWKCHVGKTAL